MLGTNKRLFSDWCPCHGSKSEQGLSVKACLHGLSVTPLVTVTNHLFNVNIGCSAIQHLTKSATFAVIHLKNEAMSYLHGLSVLFASPIVTATNRFFDGVNTGNGAFQHLVKSAALRCLA